MNNFSIYIHPQYVKKTEVEEVFPDGKSYPLHLVQKRIKLEFNSFPNFIIIIAPTGTGKSYAFPFPVLNSIKNAGGFNFPIRGLIVLPTNALIDELTANFKKAYPSLNIVKITGRALDEMMKKNFGRWEAILQMALDCDLAITNPDIINYAMHGGYHQYKSDFWKGKTGRREFHNLIEKFAYIIFDEYHLYDESQIANIWTLVQLRNVFLQENNPIKYFFASATPEPALKEFLELQGEPIEEIVEKIVSEKTNARVIHGKLEVEFHSTDNILQLIDEKIPEIRAYLEKGIKVLLILNNLRMVKELAEKLSPLFPNHRVFKSTGYYDTQEQHNKEVKKAHIIVATNKAEVGVNYGIEYCIMETGKYFQNFVQRFGRGARGDLEGKIVIAVNNFVFNKLAQLFPPNSYLDYYSFLKKVRSVMESRKLYTDTIPFYYGEYIWCIQNSITKHQSFNTRQVLNRNLEKINFFKQAKSYARYKLLKDINDIIQEMKTKYPKGHLTAQWSTWWQNYLSTYLSFRDASKVVEIIDVKEGITVKYALDWILQHKEILNIEVIEKGKFKLYRYTVGELKERDKELQYTVTTVPSVGASENALPKYKDVVTDKNLKKFFKQAVLQIESQLLTSVSSFDELQLRLIRKVKELTLTFNKKRLKIDSIDNDSSFWGG